MIRHSLIVLPAPMRVPWRWRAFIAMVVAIEGAFREALDMRRAAHNRRRLSEE
jgi:hypothetical protein